MDFFTGFECRATAQMGNGTGFGAHSGVGSMGPGTIESTGAIRSGARCWRNGSTFGSNLYFQYLTARATRVFTMQYYPNVVNGGDAPIMIIGDGAIAQVMVKHRADGRLGIYRGDGSSVNGGTGTLLVNSTDIQIVAAAAWYLLELVVTVNNTTGAADLYVNGNPTAVASIANADTQATGNATSDSIGWQGNGNAEHRVDDVYTRASRLTQADQRVLPLNMSAGNGALAQSTPSSGTDRGAMVDETTPNDDTDYNSFASTNEDTYDAPTLGSTGTIRGLMLHWRARKNDYGAVGMRSIVRISGTNYYGTETFLPVGYGSYRTLHELSPASAAAWTESEINGAQFGAGRPT